MDDLILHHYDGSPFSEKVRLMLGFKGLAWRSVKVPVILPKPDVVALTGGYRRTPFMQVGADVYCDTARIARLLDARASAPTLFPADAPLAPLLAQWADGTLFWTVIPYAMQPAGLAHIFQGVAPDVVKAFAEDRAPFTATIQRQSVPDATANLRRHAAALDAQLAAGGPWLLGAAPSVADFSVAHCIWYVRRAGPVADILAPFGHLLAWHGRMQALGHGAMTAMSADAAVAVAAAATPVTAVVAPDAGFDAGQRISVTPTDYGLDPVVGALVGLDDDEVVIRRHDGRAGTVHVHFPRAGYRIRKELT